MSGVSTSYFRNLLASHIKELQDRCKSWEEVALQDSAPEEVCDEIRTTIGLTNLLIREKLRQFEGLIDDCEYKKGEKEITCTDLQGFWDMVYHQVEKIQKSFKDLEMCQKNNWTFVQEPIVKVEPKKKTIAATAKTVVNSKVHMIAARQRLAEAKLKMRAQAAAKKRTNVCDVEIVSAGQNHLNSKQDAEEVFVTPPSIIPDSDVSGKQPTELKHTLRKMENIQITIQPEESPSTRLRKDSKISESSEEVLITPSNRRQKSDKASKVNKENLSAKKRGIANAKQTSASDVKQAAISPPPLKKEKSKEFIPLQCVTRSRKAMLEKQKCNS